ncbi:MAG: 2-C-methyl-D-erythritol 4-phosphate cytidylyltransferase [Chloroflexota bacterium]
MTTGLVIVAAGSSQRMRDVDKVWAVLGDRPVVSYAVDALVPHVDTAVLVVRDDSVEQAQDRFCPRYPHLSVVRGGEERMESVRKGLIQVGDADVVAIHDGARPLVALAILEEGIDLLDRYDAAIPVEPLHDSIKEVDARGVVVRTLNRQQLFAAQTPQAFRFRVLCDVHERARAEGRTVTDDAALLEQAGYTVHSFPGRRENFKITTRYDLQVARLLVTAGSTV